MNEGPVIVDGDEEFVREFKENSGSTIHTFRATDPEGRTGLLVAESLKPPITKTSPCSVSAAPGPSNSRVRSPTTRIRAMTVTTNSYKVIVEASDDAPGVGTQHPPSSMRKVIINVTNASESGSCLRRPALSPGELLRWTATLTDGDATTDEINAATWIVVHRNQH